jgi:hypothetical protein
MKYTKLTLEWIEDEGNSCGGAGIASRTINDHASEDTVALLAADVFDNAGLSIEETICRLVLFAFDENMDPPERLRNMGILAKAHLDENK